VHKLKKAGAKNGMFLLRHSPMDFDKYFLTVCIQVPDLLDSYKHYKAPSIGFSLTVSN